MKIVVEQLEDILSKLNAVEARMTMVEIHEDDGGYLREAELLMAKYNAEVLRLENIMVQKKLQLSQLGKI